MWGQVKTCSEKLKNQRLLELQKTQHCLIAKEELKELTPDAVDEDAHFTFLRRLNKKTVEICSVAFFTKPQRAASSSGSRPGKSTSPQKTQIRLSVPTEKWVASIDAFTALDQGNPPPLDPLSPLTQGAEQSTFPADGSSRHAPLLVDSIDPQMPLTHYREMMSALQTLTLAAQHENVSRVTNENIHDQLLQHQRRHTKQRLDSAEKCANENVRSTPKPRGGNAGCWDSVRTLRRGGGGGGGEGWWPRWQWGRRG